MKNYIYIFSFISFAICGCGNANNNNSINTINYNQDIWKDITIKSTPEPLKLPQIYDIEKMTKFGKYLLIKNSDVEPTFALLDVNYMKEITSWGYIGQGPNEYLETVLLIDGNDDYIRTFDKYELRKYSLQNDSITCLSIIDCNKEPNFLESIYAINDSLVFGYKYAPHEIGLHLMNIKTQESYTSLTAKEGYFDNKDTPYEFNFTIHKDKIVIGRKHFNQIEIYNIDYRQKTIKEQCIINFNNATANRIKKDRFYYMININADDNYIYTLNQDTDKPGKKTYVDIFSWDGAIVRRIELDDLYLHGVLIDNALYLKSYNNDDYIYRLSL